jgi:hypothetical protein
MGATCTTENGTNEKISVLREIEVSPSSLTMSVVF